MKPAVKVLFASASDYLIPTAIARMRALLPDLPLVVVSEFPPEEECRWIPYHVRRTFRENLALCRASLQDRSVRLAAVILQPRTPFWRLRAIAFVLSPWNFLAFNENFGHFMLRPRSAGTIVRHVLWRARNWFVWKFSPGGSIYTLFWRLIHPRAFRRPLAVLAAQVAGVLIGWMKAAPGRVRRLTPPNVTRPEGISVVIPSRNGRELLALGLPEVLRQIRVAGGEVIVSDNGSDDDTAGFLKRRFPEVVIVRAGGPLSFARAVNAGIEVARFSRICLLNNDMVIEPGFFAALSRAFEQVPELFCATAQIFFPEGERRQETGKAIMPFPEAGKRTDFPVSCVLPVDGEDLSYVLYGSGGCSLLDAAKLRELGGLDAIYEPAYVEDLDLGVRGWQRGWPTVFVAGARVLHQHRATTSRYYSEAQLDAILELNYLRFLARTICEPGVFRSMWRLGIARLNRLAAGQQPHRAAMEALQRAWQAPVWQERRPASMLPEQAIFALGSGAVAVFPGRPATGKPVILVATPYLPFPLAHGGAVRMYNLMRRAAAGFDQVLISFVEDLKPVPAELQDICVEVVLVKRYGSHARPSSRKPDMVEEFDSPAFRAALRQTIRKWQARVVQLEFTQMGQYAGDCAPAKTVLIEHDVTLDLHQQLLALSEDWEIRRQLERWIPFETDAWKHVDCVVAMSEKDRRMIDAPRTAALPNGVDLERFFPDEQEPEPGRLLFIGSFGHLPNLLALEFFLREVWPLLAPAGITLHVIAGARHEYFLNHYRDRIQLHFEQPGIEVEGYVSDVRPAYRRASVVIAPLLASAGTNIKIMEAMAMGRAIVSTSGGVNGLDLNDGDGVIVSDTPAGLARGILELSSNGGARRELERQARKTAMARFDWEVIASAQEVLYRSLL